MPTAFNKLNDGWNAEPNAPDPYEVTGDLLLQKCPDDWKYLADTPKADTPRKEPLRHFLFYFRDATFECDAAGYVLDLLPSPSGYPHER